MKVLAEGLEFFLDKPVTTTADMNDQTNRLEDRTLLISTGGNLLMGIIGIL